MSEQKAVPEIPEGFVVRCHDCGGTQIWKRISDGEIEVYHGCFNGKQSREAFAALTAERDAAKAELGSANLHAARLKAEMGKLNDTVARLSAPVSNGEVDQWFSPEDGIGSSVTTIAEFDALIAARASTPPDANTSWFCVPCGFTTRDAAEAQAHLGPHMIEITCPFDGQIWRFHTQEQADMLQKHLDWHAAQLSTPITTKE